VEIESFVDCVCCVGEAVQGLNSEPDPQGRLHVSSVSSLERSYPNASILLIFGCKIFSNAKDKLNDLCINNEDCGCNKGIL
jgi:hypothetical protein